ncbi:catalase [Terriglobus saanensis]|uniref:Catalase n=1 Tax=Terriglobus saanensis (strain ATCC BAA-1853 / DSM 23119 / SP1PR4) TaxID=401053 RepID=E8V2Y9_TERSS|nr:catalase [Terriglobus saanensis]ADV84686.1 Catalase [Terriglobus saanensis SP1PR4]
MKETESQKGADHGIGNGGELHQYAGGTHPQLTTQQGQVVSDDENSLKLGGTDRPGPVLLEDFVLREKINHFDHERIPERIVHARGAAAHGYFELTDSLQEFSKARILSKVGEKTPLFVRFSTVAGNAGSPDLARDVRGFAVKLYTPEGNWDLVGNNIPVFFIQDAIKFPDLIHAAKQEPDRGFPQAQTAHDTFWDFVSLTPESTHMLMWIMSDRAIPRSFRTMEGFGVHTFRLINAENKVTYVKFHWRPKLGMQSVIWDEALKINGGDPDYHRRDLWNSIDQGRFPEWELCVQLFDEEFVNRFEFDVLDATKLIPEEQIPLRVVGKMVLDRNPTNYFSETEQVAFMTQNVVPGIDFTNDPLLQGRNFSYLDTQLSRLGSPNFAQLPINAARCPVMNFQRDGHMQLQIPKGRVSYSPSSLEGDTAREDPHAGFKTGPERVEGDKLRARPEAFADHFSQALQFFNSQTPTEQNHIIAAFIFELSKVDTKAVRERMVGQLANVDIGIAQRVADGLGMQGEIKKVATTVPARTDLPESPALSILKKAQVSLEGKLVGCLIADGSDTESILALETAIAEAGAEMKIIAPKIGGATATDGSTIEADFQLAGGPSVLFDCVFLALSQDGAQTLSTEAAAVAFVHDAFSHLKVIGATPESEILLDKAGVLADAGVVLISEGDSAQPFIERAALGRIWDREPSVRTIY